MNCLRWTVGNDDNGIISCEMTGVSLIPATAGAEGTKVSTNAMRPDRGNVSP